MSERRPIPVAQPSFDSEEERRLVEVIRSGWVTQGPRVLEFEERFAEAVDADHAVATSSATTALFLSMHALGIGPGDEVIVPAATFIASVNSIVHTGATPVLVDVDPYTYNLEPERVAAAISDRTRAVMVVHQLGLPAELDAIEALSAERGVILLEDAACAVGARYRGRPIGSGSLCCFSFHPRKVIVTGEGGMITTRDGALAARLRRLRHQGMSVSDLDRHRSERVVTEHYDEIGYNFRMSDIHAALGLAQLEKLAGLLARRRELAAHYDAAFADAASIVAPTVPEWAEHSWQSYVVRLAGFERAERDAVLEAMRRRGVATRRGLMAVHRERPYRGAMVRGPLDGAEAADAQTVLLPLFAGLAHTDQDHVVAMLLESVREVRPET